MAGKCEKINGKWRLTSEASAARQRNIRAADPEKRDRMNERQRLWRANNPEKYMLQCARERAKKCGMEFNLEVEDIVIPTHCPVLGMEMNPHKRDMYSTPSLDRIDSTKGYVRGNVHVISTRANLLKKDATPGELRLLADYFTLLHNQLDVCPAA